MTALVAEAIGYGLFLAILVGPIFASLVDTSIQHGKKSGLVLAAGIWLSDAIIVALLLFFAELRDFNFSPNGPKLLATLAALVFFITGVVRLINWKKWQDKNQGYNPRKTKLLFKGIAVNTINPFTFIFWTTMVAGQGIIRQQNELSLLMFFMVLLITIITTDTLKVFLADRLGRLLHSHALRYLNLMTGLVFIITAFYIGYKFLWEV